MIAIQALLVSERLYAISVFSKGDFVEEVSTKDINQQLESKVNYLHSYLKRSESNSIQFTFYHGEVVSMKMKGKHLEIKNFK